MIRTRALFSLLPRLTSSHIFAKPQEASELSSLYAGVEDVFASGDVPRMAAAVATMRRSLGALGALPQFAGAAEKLGLLEAQLRETVEPRLADAFAQRKGESWGGS